ncbi:MAG: hypothetical protein IPP77_15765 [Bacteroidetes bacterium]|nr:hypothetical protein [Bacteroidota bacterium]
MDGAQGHFRLFHAGASLAKRNFCQPEGKKLWVVFTIHPLIIYSAFKNMMVMPAWPDGRGCSKNYFAKQNTIKGNNHLFHVIK